MVAAGAVSIIFLLVDELGFNNVAWNNGSVAKMPHISALYKDGVGLTSHYVQRWCTPTRAALLTGRYPHRMGWNQYPSKFAEELSSIPSTFALMPAMLKRANHTVSTHMLGKWHLVTRKHVFELGIFA